MFIINTFTITNPGAIADFNTFYVCIDSVSYNNLFNDSFVKDTLFLCREEATTTDQASYEGKYFIGASANLEFFNPKQTGNLGDELGDWGIEFKTRTINSLEEMVKQAQQYQFEIDTVTNRLYLDSISLIPWYKTLQFQSAHNELAILEYQKEYLSFLGFSDDEILQSMSYEDFNLKLSQGKKYPREFSKINYLKLYVDEDLLLRLKKFAQLNKFEVSKNKIVNEDLTIEYVFKKNLPAFPIQELRVALMNSHPKKTIQVSQHLIIEVENNEAILKFKY
jgi:hypothetical protein